MNALLDEIALAVKRLYRESVDPLDAAFAFEKRPGEGELGGPPMVLFLGNHSSGKSTFINHLLGQAVQKTGLAPTDDAFTVLAFGGAEEEREGAAVASNPSLPFEGLRSFGPELLSHFRMKLRPLPSLREVTLVDSPGMIDAAREGSGRGYDFTGVVRWFAERADVVLVFFDPEKPGTTGETLQVFTQALQGIDHKLLIVLNKMDRFESLPDFARAYGALCWNLGKVIPRKDLPHIYTTFVPVEGAAAPALPTKDFEAAREELVGEIRRAPARRVDNLVTQLEDHARRLLVHVKVIDAARRSLKRSRLELWALLAAIVLFGGLAGYVSLLAQAKPWLSAALFGTAALIAWAGGFVVRSRLKTQASQLLAGLSDLFERTHARELLVRERVDDLRALWTQVHARTRQTLEKVGVLAFPRLGSGERRRLEHALEKEIPELRAKLHRELSSARSC
jgi:GTP-binding protein EngB required for normal cell division